MRGRFSGRQSGVCSTRAIQSSALRDSSRPTPEPRTTSSTRPVRALVENEAFSVRISRRSRSLICSNGTGWPPSITPTLVSSSGSSDR
jgi:hypothetical protein